MFGFGLSGDGLGDWRILHRVEIKILLFLRFNSAITHAIEEAIGAPYVEKPPSGRNDSVTLFLNAKSRTIRTVRIADLTLRGPSDWPRCHIRAEILACFLKGRSIQGR